MIIKPDGYSLNVLPLVLFRLEMLRPSRVRAIRIDTRRLTHRDVKFLYGRYAKEPFYKSNQQFMMSGPVMIIELVGNHAVSRVRKLVGEAKGLKYPAGTIRWQFASPTVKRRNVVHCSDSTENAMKELANFFPKEL